MHIKNIFSGMVPTIQGVDHNLLFTMMTISSEYFLATCRDAHVWAMIILCTCMWGHWAFKFELRQPKE